MLVGQMSSIPSQTKIDTLLKNCQDEIKENNTAHVYYKFVLLLSECKAEYLNSKLTAAILKIIYAAYALNYNHEVLKYAIAECIQRIYKKLDSAKQYFFKQAIFKNISKSWDKPEERLAMWMSSCSHVPSLVEYLGLKEDIEFSGDCIDLLGKTLLDFLNTENDITAIWGLPDFILDMIKEFSDESFGFHREKLKKNIIINTKQPLIY